METKLFNLYNQLYNSVNELNTTPEVCTIFIKDEVLLMYHFDKFNKCPILHIFSSLQDININKANKLIEEILKDPKETFYPDTDILGITTEISFDYFHQYKDLPFDANIPNWLKAEANMVFYLKLTISDYFS